MVPNEKHIDQDIFFKKKKKGPLTNIYMNPVKLMIGIKRR
jgi:hypothetical protein